MSLTAVQGRTGPEPVARVLVVDDERALARLIAGYLTKAGMAAQVCHSGPEAVEAAREAQPDLIILDLGLPGMDGVEVCRRVRTFSDCYIVMLTARDDEIDKLVGLSVGADDYVTKPFSPRELIARVQAMLRRPRAGPVAHTVTEEPARVFGDLVIDAAGREVHVAGAQIELTPTEFDILGVLSARPKLAFSRAQLIEDVWGSAWSGDERLVDVHVGHLRRKLGDDPTSPRYVRTVRGVGYRMGSGE
ncbi:DNA-binding response regulator, OmpR family, contains REC and winged-helix (wHTH) domain [Pedococcus dokdonensis]|uniref:DNA-binding response regulator, OmpR family, contains REC and winged-helix (WHTH) domain n=1 Tax=Pedococcus dokdonensis TaxID=443156 RepID=A0A1H0U873_9MICO|nr:response regulator transcription factor [Pedococcus dokdonensis]SDP62403.1 DNA-binding response regulator, OmpR family, contains REC and winged-helix (wHTH) domain [Pedococcus dokdonensis]